MKKNTKIIIGILSIIIIACVVVLVFAGRAKEKSDYDKHLTASQKYVDELDYEKAIAELELAIEIEPNNAKAYLALAEVYAEMGDYESAALVLEGAKEKVGNITGVNDVLEDLEQKVVKQELVQKNDDKQNDIEMTEVYLEYYVAPEPFGIYPFDGGGNRQYGMTKAVGTLTFDEIVSYLPKEIDGVDSNGMYYPMTVTWSEYDKYNSNEVGTYALYGTVKSKEDIKGNIPNIIGVITLTSDVPSFGGYYKIVEEDVTLFYSRLIDEDMVINIHVSDNLEEKLSEFASGLVAYDGVSDCYTGITSIEWNTEQCSVAAVGNYDVVGRVVGARTDIIYPDIKVRVNVQ